MTWPKITTGFLVIVMMVLQLALAQHMTVHFGEPAYAPAQHGTASDIPAPHDNDQPPDQLCHLCLLAKHLPYLAIAAVVFFHLTAIMLFQFAVPFYRRQTGLAAALYNARAPPAPSAA